MKMIQFAVCHVARTVFSVVNSKSAKVGNFSQAPTPGIPVASKRKEPGGRPPNVRGTRRFVPTGFPFCVCSCNAQRARWRAVKCSRNTKTCPHRSSVLRLFLQRAKGSVASRRLFEEHAKFLPTGAPFCACSSNAASRTELSNRWFPRRPRGHPNAHWFAGQPD